MRLVLQDDSGKELKQWRIGRGEAAVFGVPVYDPDRSPDVEAIRSRISLEVDRVEDEEAA